MGDDAEAGRSAAETAEAPEHVLAAKDSGPMPSPKSTRIPSFQFYPSDFLSGEKVSRMSYTEIGIYIVLLSHAWLARGLPTQPAELAKMLKMNPQRFSKLWTGVLSEAFVVRGGRLVNLRQESERKKQDEFRARQAENGSKGGRPSKGSGSSGESQMKARALQTVDRRSQAVDQRSSEGGSGGTAVTRPAALVSRRRPDAAYEHESGLYVPNRAHQDLLALHPSGFEAELFAWYPAVCVAWHGRNTGADMIRFWKARHDETWPPEKPAAVQSSARRPAWASKAVSQ